MAEELESHRQTFRFAPRAIFTDSSNVVKIGRDAHHLLTEILPRFRPGGRNEGGSIWLRRVR